MQEEWSRTTVRRRVRYALEQAPFAERTRRAYRRWTYAYLDAVTTDAPLDASQAQRFLDNLDGPPGTLRQARSALNFLLELTTGQRVGLQLDEIPAPEQPPRFLTSQQATEVLAHAEGPAGLAAHLIHDTGISVVEAAFLEIGSLSPALDTLKLPARTAGLPTIPVPAVTRPRIQCRLVADPAPKRFSRIRKRRRCIFVRDAIR